MKAAVKMSQIEKRSNLLKNDRKINRGHCCCCSGGWGRLESGQAHVSSAECIMGHYGQVGQSVLQSTSFILTLCIQVAVTYQVHIVRVLPSFYHYVYTSSCFTPSTHCQSTSFILPLCVYK